MAETRSKTTRQVGDVFTIEGSYAVNPLTLESEQWCPDCVAVTSHDGMGCRLCRRQNPRKPLEPDTDTPCRYTVHLHLPDAPCVDECESVEMPRLEIRLDPPILEPDADTPWAV